MSFTLHPSGILTWSDPSTLKPGEGGNRGFGSNRSRRGVFFDRASVLWYKNTKLNFFTFTVPRQKETDTWYTAKLSMLLENYRTKHKRGHPEGFSDYVYCAETQQRGSIHFHLLAPAYVPIKGLNNYWTDLIGQRSSNAVDVQHVPSEINSIPAYMCKYFTKQTYTNPAGELCSHRSVQCRSFNSSKGLRMKCVPLEALPGKPLAEQVKHFDRLDKSTGELVRTEIVLRYYDTRETLDRYFKPLL